MYGGGGGGAVECGRRQRRRWEEASIPHHASSSDPPGLQQSPSWTNSTLPSPDLIISEQRKEKKNGMAWHGMKQGAACYH